MSSRATRTSATKRKRPSDSDVSMSTDRERERARRPRTSGAPATPTPGSTTPRRSGRARGSLSASASASASVEPQNETRKPAPARAPRTTQTARRTGGPLPPQPNRMMVEIPARRAAVETPRRGKSRAATLKTVRTLSSDDEEEDENEGEEEEEEEEEEEDDEDEEIGTPGPGPRTRALRDRSGRAMHPVPQPNQSVFHEVMRRRRSRRIIVSDDPEMESASEIIDIRSSHSKSKTGSASPQHEAEAESFPETLPPNLEVTMVNGEQAYVVDDSDSANEAQSSLEKFDCPIHKCSQVLASTKDVARHLREHAKVYDPSGGEAGDSAALDASRARVAELEKKQSSLQERLEVSDGRAAAALQSASDLEARIATLTAESEAKDGAVAELAEVKSQLSEQGAKLAKLEEQAAAAEEADAELEKLASQVLGEGEAPAPEVQLKLLQKKLKRARSALKNAESDASFLRDQYQTASSSAVAEVQRANELAAKVAKLENLLSVGLKQRDLHAGAVARKAAGEIQVLRDQLNLLLAQSRRTDDTLRHKAALYARMHKESQERERELHDARSRADVVTRRNTELRDQVTLLRGRLLGAFDPASASDDGEGDDGDETDDDAPAPAQQAPPRPPPPSHMPSFAPDNNSARPSPALADATLAPAAIDMFRCKWVLEGDAMCAEIFHTRDELETHGVAHIEKLALAIDHAPAP